MKYFGYTHVQYRFPTFRHGGEYGFYDSIDVGRELDQIRVLALRAGNEYRRFCEEKNSGQDLMETLETLLAKAGLLLENSAYAYDLTDEVEEVETPRGLTLEDLPRLRAEGAAS